MKLYVLNYYSGGVPFDGCTQAVFDNFEDAKKQLNKSAKDCGYDKGHVEWELFRDEHGGDYEGQPRSWYIDDDEYGFFGGYRIEVQYLKTKYSLINTSLS